MPPEFKALKPHPAAAASAALSLRARAWIEGTELCAEFEAAEGADSVAWPAPEGAAARRDRLWEDTCLEVFFGKPGESSYFEINASPAGHWNLYAFDGYRSGMRPGPGDVRVRFGSEQDGTRRLALRAPLPGSVRAPLEASLTAVIRRKSGVTEYWALGHAAEKPDFHQRESFVWRIQK